MSVKKKITVVMMISILSILLMPLLPVNAQTAASLTGVVYDSGVDTDSDGTFDYLEVGVEVNVSISGIFQVEVFGLYDLTYNYIYAPSLNYTYLDVGIHVVSLSLDGSSIYASGFNPAIVSAINLYDESYNPLDSLSLGEVSLSREYSYTEFDVPPASLTGTVYDSGVDTDSDGTFDYLEVGVEVNVSISGIFQVDVSGLYDLTYNYIYIWNQNATYLDVGIHVVSLSLDGSNIYASGFNPAIVSAINLYDESYNPLGPLHDISLSREYSYTEFDVEGVKEDLPAFLTGVISDRGLDTDGDGAFDYLEVGVEVNVTSVGDYKVQVWNLLDSDHNYLDVSGHKSEYLDAGVHVVNVSLYGPTIYVSGLNPVEVSEIALYSIEYVPPLDYGDNWLDSVSDVPLTKEYLNTEFNSPFTDVEAIFVVYPDGRVVMRGAVNYTHVQPPNTELSMHGVVEVKESGTSTLASANFTFMGPAEEWSRFPFNSSAFTLSSEYHAGLLTTTLSGSTIFPSGIASEFPFNATDFTVIGQYTDNTIAGDVTVDILPIFPLDDIAIEFQGNNTYVYLQDSLRVIYGTYPDFGEINATVLDVLLQQLNTTIPGRGPDSLYNMTSGLFECTMLNTQTTQDNAIGAIVDFEAEFQGDIIATFVNMTDQPAFMYELLDTAWSSIESGSFQLAYAHALKEADLTLVFTFNMTKLIDSMIPILPEIPDVPPELVSFIESILETTYCTVDSAKVSLDYAGGRVTLNVTATIQDDFNAEINHIKSLFLNYSDISEPLTSQLQTINETQMDVANFRMSLNLTETSMESEVQGFAVLPTLDWINATNFKLERFFNITAGEDEPPRDSEKLKVTVEGASNTTHKVKIIRTGTVPEPDIDTPDRMVWNNQSISSLKDLTFQIEHDNTPPVIGTPTHTPESPSPNEVVRVSVNVTDDFGIRDAGVILSYGADGDGAWNDVTMTKTTGDTYEGQIPGLPAGTNVQYRITAYDHAGNFAINDKNGQFYGYIVAQVAPFWMQWWFWVIIIVGIGALAGAAYFLMKRKR